MNKLLSVAGAVMILAGSALAQKGGEWGQGIRFHTKWESAIKEVQETGKLLFIYNGWKDKGI